MLLCPAEVLPSIQYDVRAGSGNFYNTTFYGALLCPGIREASPSPYQNLYVLPLLIDIGFFVVLALLLARRRAELMRTPAALDVLVTLAIRFWGLISLILLLSVQIFEWSASAWYEHPWVEIQSVELAPAYGTSLSAPATSRPPSHR